MKAGHSLVLVLYAIALALLAVVLGMGERTTDEPLYGALGLSLALASLTGSWLVLGGGFWLTRLVGTSVALVLVAWWVDRISVRPTYAELLCVVTLNCLLVALIVGWLRWRGHSWVRAYGGWDEAATTPSRQYTLAALFGVTTSLAVVLAGVRWMDFPWAHAVEVGVLLACLVSVSALMQVLASSGCLVTALIPLIYIGAVLFPQVYQLRVALPYSVAIALWVGMMRIAGYRWVRRVGNA